MANRFSVFTPTEYVGLPLDNIQRSIEARDQQIAGNLQNIATDYASMVGVPAADLSAQAVKDAAISEIRAKVEEVAKGKLDSREALRKVRAIVKDPKVVQPLLDVYHNYLQYKEGRENIDEFVKTNKTEVGLADHLSVYQQDVPYDVNAFNRDRYRAATMPATYYDLTKEMTSLLDKLKPDLHNIGITEKEYGWLVNHQIERVDPERRMKVIQMFMNADARVGKQLLNEIRYKAYLENPKDVNAGVISLYGKKLQEQIKDMKNQINVLGDPSNEDVRRQEATQLVTTASKRGIPYSKINITGKPVPNNLTKPEEVVNWILKNHDFTANRKAALDNLLFEQENGTDYNESLRELMGLTSNDYFNLGMAYRGETRDMTKYLQDYVWLTQFKEQNANWRVKAKLKAVEASMNPNPQTPYNPVDNVATENTPERINMARNSALNFFRQLGIEMDPNLKSVIKIGSYSKGTLTAAGGEIIESGVSTSPKDAVSAIAKYNELLPFFEMYGLPSERLNFSKVVNGKRVQLTDKEMMAQAEVAMKNIQGLATKMQEKSAKYNTQISYSFVPNMSNPADYNNQVLNSSIMKDYATGLDLADEMKQGVRKYQRDKKQFNTVYPITYDARLGAVHLVPGADGKLVAIPLSQDYQNDRNVNATGIGKVLQQMVDMPGVAIVDPGGMSYLPVSDMNDANPSYVRINNVMNPQYQKIVTEAATEAKEALIAYGYLAPNATQGQLRQALLANTVPVPVRVSKDKTAAVLALKGRLDPNGNPIFLKKPNGQPVLEVNLALNAKGQWIPFSAFNEFEITPNIKPTMFGDILAASSSNLSNLIGSHWDTKVQGLNNQELKLYKSGIYSSDEVVQENKYENVQVTDEYPQY